MPLPLALRDGGPHADHVTVRQMPCQRLRQPAGSADPVVPAPELPRTHPRCARRRSDRDEQIDFGQDGPGDLFRMNGDEQRGFQCRRGAVVWRIPGRRQQMMRLVQHEPMRPRHASAEGNQMREQFLEIGRTVVEWETEKAHDQIAIRPAQHVQYLGGRRRTVRVAKHDGALESGEVALRVDQAELISALRQLFEQRSRERRLAASGRAANHDGTAVHGCVRGPSRRSRRW